MQYEYSTWCSASKSTSRWARHGFSNKLYPNHGLNKPIIHFYELFSRARPPRPPFCKIHIGTLSIVFFNYGGLGQHRRSDTSLILCIYSNSHIAPSHHHICHSSNRYLIILIIPYCTLYSAWLLIRLSNGPQGPAAWFFPGWRSWRRPFQWQRWFLKDWWP